MTTTPTTPELQDVVARLDTIIRELEGLRRQLTAPPTNATPLKMSRVDQLYGAAGTGSRDEYDPNLAWSRFAA